MQRRAVGAIVGATLVTMAVAGYAVADAHDVVPGVLTLSDVPQPSPAPSMQAQSGLGTVQSQSGTGTEVSASSVEELWTSVAAAASEGKWTTWGIVVDAESGQTLLDSASGTSHTPASTTKILTATTALSDMRSSTRLATGTTTFSRALTCICGGKATCFWDEGQDSQTLSRGVQGLPTSTATPPPPSPSAASPR